MKKIYRIFATVLLLGVTSACEDALDKVPLDGPSDETFFSNEAELKLGINGVYQDLYWMNFVPDQIILDNLTDLGFLRGDQNGMEAFGRGTHSSETAGGTRTWALMYNGIARANNLLKNMERAREVVTEDLYNRIQAEALVLRAYYYYWLISLYGDVPFPTEIPGTIEEGELPRTPRVEIASHLFTDLDLASQSLPDSWGDADQGRVTAGVALGLKARIALLVEDYQAAAAAAKAVMDLNAYSLHPDYEALFTYQGEYSAETMFVLPFQHGLRDNLLPRELGPRITGSWSRIVPSQFLVDSYECTDGLPIDESTLYDPAHPFENRDPRLDATLVRPQSLVATYVYETHRDSLETWQVIGEDSTRMANEDGINDFASFSGYQWRKYASETDLSYKGTTAAVDFILMRYAEVLLTYAEAKIELGQIDQSVLDAMNAVRARAYGVDPSATTEYPAVTTLDQARLRTIVRRERKVELALEGFRLMDIRRWEIAEHVMPGKLVGRPIAGYSSMSFVPEIDEYGHPNYDGAEELYKSVDQRTFDPDRDYLWPVPQADMNVNSALVQNPGY